MNAEERAAQILAGATLGGMDTTDLRRRIAEGLREAVMEEREACAALIHAHADRYTQWIDRLHPEDREKSARWQELNALEEAIRGRGQVTGGTFTICHDGRESEALRFDASPEDLRAAIDRLMGRG